MGDGPSKEQLALEEMRTKIRNMEKRASDAQKEKDAMQKKIDDIVKDNQEKESQRMKESAERAQEIERIQNESKRMQEKMERIYEENQRNEQRRAQEVELQLREALRVQEEYRREDREKELQRTEYLAERVREIQGLQEENRRVQEENQRMYKENHENELRRAREVEEQLREAYMIKEEERKIQEVRRKLQEERMRQAEEKKLNELAKKIEESAKRRVEEEKYLRMEAERYLNEGIPPVDYPTGEEIQAVKKMLRYEEGNFHVAITGVSGSGKSSLVNALRGFSNNSTRYPGAAETGTRETTKQIGRYHDPTREWIIWYDIPGAGTLNVPDWKYFNSQGLFIFDIIIIAIDSRFTKIDAGLLFSCQRFDIPTFVIRSKGDTHIQNILSDEGSDDEDDNKWSLRFKAACDRFVNDTRDEFKSILEEAGLPQQRVYTVSKDTLRNIIRGLPNPGHIIHEVELMRDILHAANMRYNPKQSLISKVQLSAVEEHQLPVSSN